MPNGLLAPEHRIPQVAVKVTACIDCGDPVEYQFNVPLRCPDCRRNLKRDRDRKDGWKRARARGANQIGETFECERCGLPTVRTSGCKKYCEECRPAMQREYHRPLDLARADRNLGTVDACAECGSDFVVAHSRQRVCLDCRVIRPDPSPPICLVCRQWFVRTSNRQKYCPEHTHVRVKNEKRGWYAKKRQDIDYLSAKYAKALEYQNKKYASDHVFALNKRMASAIYQALGDRKSGRKWEVLVGYTCEQLMRHLERQFLRGMTWENRDRWHIDHIVPLAAFNYSSADDMDFRAAWALTNLRPLWKKDNLEKSDRRIFLL